MNTTKWYKFLREQQEEEKENLTILTKNEEQS